MSVRTAHGSRAPPFSSTGGGVPGHLADFCRHGVGGAPAVERWTLCTPRVRACSQQGFTRRRRWRRSRVHPNKGRGGNKRRSGLRCAVRVGGMMKAREKWRKVKGGTEDEMIGCLEFSTERRGRWPRLVVLSDRYTVTTQTTHVFTLQRNRKMTMAVRVRDFKLRD